MKDIFAFIANIPWWVWIVAVFWYFLICLRKENNKLNEMTDAERIEYQTKIRRKHLGLD